jgi:hypothetical protein
MEAMQPSLLDIVTRPALRVGVPFQASRTSRAAAARLAPKVAGRRERVIALFRSGARLTADEAAARLEWKPTQTRPRVCEAAKWGILVDTGKERPSDDGAAMVGIGADGNGDPAIFRKDLTGTVNDGVNGIVRDDGVAYVRFSGNPIA